MPVGNSGENVTVFDSEKQRVSGRDGVPWSRMEVYLHSRRHVNLNRTSNRFNAAGMMYRGALGHERKHYRVFGDSDRSLSGLLNTDGCRSEAMEAAVWPKLIS